MQVVMVVAWWEIQVGGTIIDCYATGEVSGSIAGGLVGNVWEGSTITNCYATGKVKGEKVGGLVGENSYSTIKNCYATGDVSGHSDGHVGGLIGRNDKGIITNSYASGNVNSGSFIHGSHIGGLAGSNSGGRITYCYATGNVKGDDKSYSGGLVGSNDKDGTMTNCYATGNVKGSYSVGGLVGINGNIDDSWDNKTRGSINGGGKITNCYASGQVSGITGERIGGLVGIAGPISKITNSYYDRQTSGQVDISKGEPKSTAQMKQQATFIGWDFDKIWKINEDYPNFQSKESIAEINNIPSENLIDKRDGKKYKTVVIGMQTWMAENLNYNAKGSKCYDNKPANCSKYGRLYDYTAANNAFPSGWHLSSYSEWKTLREYMGDSSGKKLKAKSGWKNNSNGTDDYGFSALPGGGGGTYFFKDFVGVGESGYWWGASKSFSNAKLDSEEKLTLNDSEWYGFLRGALFSVRCIKD